MFDAWRSAGDACSLFLDTDGEWFFRVANTDFFSLLFINLHKRFFSSQLQFDFLSQDVGTATLAKFTAEMQMSFKPVHVFTLFLLLLPEKASDYKYANEVS